MPRARTYSTEAIIIKKTKLGEADRILTLYTPDMGKVQGVAKGVRRPKSKLSGHLELLTHSMVMLVGGRNLDTITGSQAIHSFVPLKSSLELCACALYATELVNLFGVDRQENRPLFELLLDFMQELSECESSSASFGLLRYFEINLLKHVGYQPQLGECVVCKQPLHGGGNCFSVASGGAICPRCRHTQSFTYPLSTDTLRSFRCLQDGDWTSIAEISREPRIRREMEMLLRYYFRYLLERDIRSTVWLDMLRHMNAVQRAPQSI